MAQAGIQDVARASDVAGYLKQGRMEMELIRGIEASHGRTIHQLPGGVEFAERPSQACVCDQ